MTKWYTISGRFTEEEKEIIKKFEKKMKVTDNQLVRLGVEIAIGFASMGELFTRPDLAPLQDYAKEVQKAVNNPKIKKEIENAGKRWASKLREDQIKMIEKEAVRINQELDVFQNHEKRGQKPRKKRLKKKTS